MKSSLAYGLGLLICMQAQASDSLFVELKDGKRLQGSFAIQKIGLFTEGIVHENDSIPLKEVMTLSNADGYFRRFSQGFTSSLVMRIEDGKAIDYFETSSIEFRQTAGIATASAIPGHAASMGTGFHMQQVTSRYYNANNGDLHPIEYGYLKKDLIGHAGAAEHLATYNKKRWYQYGGIVGGLVLGVATYAISNQSKAGNAAGTVILFGGIGFGVVQGWNKAKYLNFALEAYEEGPTSAE